MRRIPGGSLLLCLAGCLWLAGCGNWGGEADDGIEELGLTEPDEASNSTPAAEPGASRPAVIVADGSAARGTEVRVPLVKTIVQQLRQRSADGWVNSRSALELTFVVSLEESHVASGSGGSPDPRKGQRRYQVQYQRVRLLHELPGEPPLNYDSSAPPEAIPLAALPYHGLPKNGFQFWLGHDLQLLEVIGFESFLERCLAAIPAVERAGVRASLPVSSPHEGVAWFVDESIGLIPPEASRSGDTWTRNRTILQPVPLAASTRYTLRQMTAQSADVDLSGTFAPSTGGMSRFSERGAMAGAGSGGDVTVIVRGGQLLGQLRVDRQTGLPVQSHVEQSLEMRVRLADGSEFEQYKTTVSTLGPPSGTGVPATAAHDSVPRR